MCQGRQYHGWFGNGTCPDQGAKNGGRGPGDFDSRVRDVAYGAAASLPVRLRTRFSRQLHPKGLARLAALMRAWNGGASLDHAAFADRFFGRPADDPVVRQLRGVARQTDVAKSHDELREAATGLAAEVQAVGLDRWPRFLDGAEERAEQACIIPAQLAIPMPAVPGLPALPGIGPSEKETIAAAREIQRLLGRALQLLGMLRAEKPEEQKSSAGQNAPAQSSAGRATVSPDRRRHILDGDPDGTGGHRHGTGRPGKSEFPAGWSDHRSLERLRTWRMIRNQRALHAATAGLSSKEAGKASISG